MQAKDQTMNAKQQALIDEFLGQIDPSYRTLLGSLAAYAAALGYPPVRCKTQDLTIDFRSSRLRRALMKLELNEQPHDGFRCGERRVPGLRLRFYASASYSAPFQRAVQRVIEAFGGKYTGCYGCGRCLGQPRGYTYVYPDGRRVFRCGSELLSVFGYEACGAEIQRLLKAQAEDDLQTEAARKAAQAVD